MSNYSLAMLGYIRTALIQYHWLNAQLAGICTSDMSDKCVLKTSLKLALHKQAGLSDDLLLKVTY